MEEMGGWEKISNSMLLLVVAAKNSKDQNNCEFEIAEQQIKNSS